ncbi:MAG: folate-binding protein YgfZ [Gammaproteobacteria bacterium]|nr:folate-binding protein YgfZ [Gammaproteobacteria bacterium]
MDTRWLNHLQNIGAIVSDSSPLHFQELRAEVQAVARGNTLSILDHLGVIRVQGADSEAFLQGQFSNDLTQVTTKQAQLTAWCSPKGRVLTLLLVVRMANEFYMILPRELLTAILKRLRMFVLRSKVQLEDLTSTHLCLGCAGAQSRLHLQALYAIVPENNYNVTTLGTTAILRMPGEPNRFLLLTTVDDTLRQWPRLSNAVALTGPSAWQWLDIQAGLATVLSATSDEFIPQMLNLDRVDAVSFSKGCYPGQEIVARAHYLGTVKRRLYKAHSDHMDLVQPGAEIYPADPQGSSIGKVVVAQPAPDGGTDLLIVLHRDAAATGGLRLGGTHHGIITLQSLPYSLDPEP